MFPAHFDGKRFYNPNAPQARGPRDVLRWKLQSRPRASPRFVSDVRPTVPPPRADAGELRVTLVNHSTVLIQQPGSNILTDPIWSERASPVSWAGPRRRRAPGVRKDDLPAIDIVLLSHNHYDHLDLGTLRWLERRDRPEFVVPLGVAALLRSQGMARVKELDWGESHGSITAVPALHFSARGIFDRNRTLWCGYMVASVAGPIFFAGDTAFGEHFTAIRERFGAPRLGLLPIGAYEPRWFMSAIHIDPEQALEAHAILGCESSIATHHGTFQLADESLDEPAETLRSCSPPSSFWILKNGGHASFK